MSKNLISIIMNCHNGEKYLKQSIESILNQNYKNWELIFFDNQSTDNSISIIEQFKDERIKIFKKVIKKKNVISKNLFEKVGYNVFSKSKSSFFLKKNKTSL